MARVLLEELVKPVFKPRTFVVLGCGFTGLFVLNRVCRLLLPKLVFGRGRGVRAGLDAHAHKSTEMVKAFVAENELEQVQVQVSNDVSLNVLLSRGFQTRTEPAPIVLFVHGFPESWWSWRYQLSSPEMNERFLMAAFDLRGYGDSSKPSGESAYRKKYLLDDIDALIRYLKDRVGKKFEKFEILKQKVYLVSHDWGSVIAWDFAVERAKSIDKLVSMSVPHPAIQATMYKSWKQLKKSWYILFDQFFWLPENAMSGRDYAALKAVFRSRKYGVKNRDALTDADVEVYKNALANDGSLSCAIHFYRENLGLLKMASFVMTNIANKIFGSRARTVDLPVLVLWGKQDGFVGSEFAEPCLPYIPHKQSKVVVVDDCSHWVQQEHSPVVEGELFKFLSE